MNIILILFILTLIIVLGVVLGLILWMRRKKWHYSQAQALGFEKETYTSILNFERGLYFCTTFRAVGVLIILYAWIHFGLFILFGGFCLYMIGSLWYIHIIRSSGEIYNEVDSKDIEKIALFGPYYGVILRESTPPFFQKIMEYCYLILGVLIVFNGTTSLVKSGSISSIAIIIMGMLIFIMGGLCLTASPKGKSSMREVWAEIDRKEPK